MTHLTELETPAALIDVQRMQHNIARMQQRLDDLGVSFRPHVKTSKCLSVVQAQLAGGARGITVSTLKEAEQFFAAGIDDILYAVGIVPGSADALLAIGRVLHGGGMRLDGVMAHAGSSYDLDEHEALRRIAEQELAATVLAADRLRQAGCLVWSG
jgi:D-serine deaminase-like pyridoxal phosphate-dependent protein